MALQNLFNSSEKNLSVTDMRSIGSDVESVDYIRRFLEEKDLFIPHIDYSDPSNFSYYGLAEQYYSDSVGYILNQYPYDGSLKEKLEWDLSSSYLDKYVFDKLYPRTAGYITLGLNYTGSALSTSNDYSLFGTSSYIFVRGGPHSASSGMVSKPLYQTFNFSNVYDSGSTKRQSNLEINANDGITLEFWLNKNGFTALSESRKQVIFDLWNSASLGASNYGRFRVEIHPGTSGETNRIWIDLSSGSSGLSPSSSGSIVGLGQGLNLTNDNWHQYSIVVKNTGSQMQAVLYASGTINDSVVTGTNINPITGSSTMIAIIGSLITQTTGSSSSLGWGALSASIDELRYWKVKRNSQQIGRYWFTQIGGGINTDASAINGLGLYYKFNEGILNSGTLEPLDTKILDYSGRLSNGSWTGYVLGSRNTASAMELSRANNSEFKDPIMYSFHTGVINLTSNLGLTGSAWDQINNSSLYNSFPEWILENDLKHSSELKKLTQTMASYFDNLHLQIKALPTLKSANYISSSFKPFPFVSRYLESVGLAVPDLFVNVNPIESLNSRDDFRHYELKLNDIKNRIYQNLYNNLPYILKSKGTEKSFRNVLRCFGIDDELIKINLYGDNVTYEFKDSSKYGIATKKYANFNYPDKFAATVYQITSSATASARSYIPAPQNVLYHGNTFEIEALFPKKFGFDSPVFFNTPFITSSIFGCHTANCVDGADKTWVSIDQGNFQIYAIRPTQESKEVRFVLSGTSGYQLPILSSSIFTDVYDNSKWNLSLRVSPVNYPFVDGVTGSGNGNFLVEFTGYNCVLDVVANQFYITGTINYTSGSNFIQNPKRFYLGAHRTNFTGSVLQYTDIEITDLMVWFDRVEDVALIAHAKDSLNYGRIHPLRNAYMSELSRSWGR